MATPPLTEVVSVEDALRAMIQHSFDNPTHGVHCACKDEHIKAARRALQVVFDEFPPTKPTSWPVTKQNANVLFHRLIGALVW